MGVIMANDYDYDYYVTVILLLWIMVTIYYHTKIPKTRSIYICQEQEKIVSGGQKICQYIYSLNSFMHTYKKVVIKLI